MTSTQYYFGHAWRAPARPSRLLLGVSFMMSGISLASAQQTAPPAERPAADSTVELSPFEVNAERDVGYVATSSLAGSRLNTDLKDTAASISVLTSEFIQDIGATTLADAMQWSTNSQLDMGDTLTLASSNDAANEPFTTFSSFRVRGLPATVTRNYFPWSVPTDVYNVDRVEEARGPNSILFGIGSAGGIVNVATKRAQLNRTLRAATVGISSHDGYRGTIDVNQPIGDRLAFRFNAVADRTGSFRNFIFEDTRQAHLAATFKLTPKTTLRAEYETGRVRRGTGGNQQATDSYINWVNAGSQVITAPIPTNQNAARGVGRLNNAVQIYYIGNTGTLLNMAGQYRSSGTDFALSPEIAPYEVNIGGPGSMQRPHFDAISLNLEQQFGENTFVELAYNHQEYATKNYQPAGGDAARLYIDPNVSLPTGQPNPHVGQFMAEGESWLWENSRSSDNIRLTVAHELDVGKWGNYRFAAMGEDERRSPKQYQYAEAWEGAPFHVNPENAANIVRRRSYLTPGEWGSFHRTMPLETGLIQGLTDPVTGRTLNSIWVPRNINQVRDNPEDQQSVLLALQARFFNNRLVLGAGYRRDWLDVTTHAGFRDPVTNIFATDYSSAETTRYEGRTRTIGVVYHLTRMFSLFYNNSDNFDLPPSIFLVPHGDRASNSENKTSDVGVALNLFDGKLVARATYYKTDLTNGATSGYGSTNNRPEIVGDRILDAVVEAGLMPAAEADTYRVIGTGSTYARQVEGYEFSLTANPTRNWRLQANFSYTDGFTSEVAPEIQEWYARVSPLFKRAEYQSLPTGTDARTVAEVLETFEDYHDEQLALVGLVLPGNRQYKTNLFTSYTFSDGPLDGVIVGGGYTHQTKLPIGLYADGSLQYGPSWWDSNAMLGYKFSHSPVPWLKRLRVQLNVKNVFNEDEAYILRRVPGANPGDPEITRRTKIREPRTWRLTASFEF